MTSMAKTSAEKQKAYRDRLRGGPPAVRELKPHGTTAAALRHQRAGEPMCAECRVAWREHSTAMQRNARAAKRAGK